jgi:hypothetical protein
MLSDKLMALSGHFHEWARQNAVLDVGILRRLSEEMTAHAADAVRLEAAQMPPGYTLPAAPAALPSNVVRVDFIGHSLRNYRGFLQGVAGNTPGGAA